MTDLRGVPPSKVISAPSGFVQCSTHNVRRKAECCEMKAVLNADMEVIDYICVCKHPFTCRSASERQSNGLAAASNARRNAPDGESSGAAPLVIDASSTSMTAQSKHHHHGGQPSAARAADREAGVSTLFAVSFYDASRSTPVPSTSATAAAVSPKPSAKDGEDRGDENDEGTKANAMTISDSDSDTDDVDSLDNSAPFTAGATPATAAAASFPAAPRERPRYYDSVQNASTGGHAPPAKVCWGCGMSGHEKPACPNALCRTCHQKRGPYGSPHRCTPVITPSPFIVYPTPSEWRAATQKTAAAAGEPNGMAAVRCVACNEYGHFDCSTVVLPSSYALVASSSTGPAAVPHTLISTCCFCGVRGHTVFDCQQREHVNPDYFERRNQLFADSVRRGSSITTAGAPFNNSGSSSGYGHPSQQQHQQRFYGSPPGGAPSSSSSFTRYGNHRGGGGSGQRRERDWCDNREQRVGGNQYSNSHREGSAYYNDSYGGDRDHQRRRYESPSFSRAGGGPAPSSSPLLHGRDRFQEGGQRHHEERSRDSYGGSHQRYSEGEHGGAGSRGHDQRLHYSQQSQHSHRHGSSRRGGRLGDSGYYSDDNLF
ncbi:conserved hypothetical protein [Leishmania infantum JPCM5]|uniref:Uncharacterized protein n=2 Tax=Leishmania infantum TaxID=5671 RepID=A4HUX1_LEIIN|nr:conserved hypothetical protein [Leishmania infantum JPCM5]CAC9460598.1 hypothetical_protein_-_conserved [Leishmania infantum]CAM66233.1 conserved hypothetical protein [Leishmania infantum JPCM5]SUZ39841.1 hypothetical_protein_-_conserved [Leishmania infantum]|eukprot:XP_001463862.1 conserved hypothetical protein [Leishmania infantum JPCM5]